MDTVPCKRDGYFLSIMKKSISIILLFVASITMLVVSGCATNDNPYEDEKEYSDMPWNTPQQWEGSRSMPGMSPQY